MTWAGIWGSRLSVTHISCGHWLIIGTISVWRNHLPTNHKLSMLSCAFKDMLCLHKLLIPWHLYICIVLQVCLCNVIAVWYMLMPTWRTSVNNELTCVKSISGCLVFNLCFLEEFIGFLGFNTWFLWLCLLCRIKRCHQN